MIVKEDYTVVMDKIRTIPYGKEEKEQNIEYNQKQAEFKRIIQNMSADELKEVLRKLEAP